jgi:MoaA/NifB/PqqE/SkfB family radical SAM enzyme
LHISTSITFKLKTPIKISWIFTNKCNLECKHCYLSSSSHIDQNQELSKDESISIIKKLKKEGIFSIHFTGGEPFAKPDFLNIISEASRHNIEITISTNGTLIEDEALSTPREINLNTVQVSLDGATKKTHDFFRGEKSYDKTI